MKLLKREQEDLFQVLRQYGIDQHFHLTKQKGWVIIKHPNDHQGTFAFHRKETSSLEGGRLIVKSNYSIKAKGQIDEISNWPEVIAKFSDWLMSINFLELDLAFFRPKVESQPYTKYTFKLSSRANCFKHVIIIENFYIDIVIIN